MKAIRVHQFGGPEVMKLEELPDLHPGPGEVVVRVKAVGVNPVDTYIRSGAYVAGTLSGAYAEQARCKESQVHPLPEKISFAQGAAVNIPYATAYRALFHRARALPGETVLVHGASGGVGIASVQLARAAGMKVIGTAGTDRGRNLVMEQGAHHVLDHRAADYL